MILYVLFLASVTSYVMIHLNIDNFPDAETEQKECYLDFASNSAKEKVFTVLVVLFSLLNIMIEFSQMIRVRKGVPGRGDTDHICYR